jgi:hypothetical protein
LDEELRDGYMVHWLPAMGRPLMNGYQASRDKSDATTGIRGLFDGRFGVNCRSVRFPVRLPRIIDLIVKTIQFGRQTHLWKLDLKSGYKQVKLATEHQRYFAVFDLDGSILVHTTVPMGWNASVAVFQAFTTATAAVIRRKFPIGQISFLENYVDDFYCAAPTHALAVASFESAKKTMALLGVTLNNDKTIPPDQVATITGRVVDIPNWRIYCTREKLQRTHRETLDLIRQLNERTRTGHRRAPLAQAERVQGLLAHVLETSLALRPWMRLLYAAVANPRHDFIYASAELIDDLTMIAEALLLDQGTSLDVFASNIPVDTRAWLTTDARLHVICAIRDDKPALGVDYDPQLAQQVLLGELSNHHPLATAAVHTELLAIVAGVEVAGDAFRNRIVGICSDCLPDVNAINSNYSSSARLNALLRRLTILKVRYDCQLVARHVAGIKNTWADGGTRGAHWTRAAWVFHYDADHAL